MAVGFDYLLVVFHAGSQDARAPHTDNVALSHSREPAIHPRQPSLRR